MARKGHDEASLDSFASSYTEPGADFDHVIPAGGPTLPTGCNVDVAPSHASYYCPLTTAIYPALVNTTCLVAIDPTHLYEPLPAAHPVTLEDYFLPDTKQWASDHQPGLMSPAEQDEYSRATYMALVSPTYSTIGGQQSCQMTQAHRASQPLSVAYVSESSNPSEETPEKHSMGVTYDEDGRIARQRFISDLEHRTCDGNCFKSTRLSSQHLSESALNTLTNESVFGLGGWQGQNSTSQTKEVYGLPKRLQSDRLASNWVAATISRATTQAAVEELEVYERQMYHYHEALVSEEEQLRNQVYLLQNELLLHVDCCPMIQKYMSVSAEYIARNVEEAAAGTGGDNQLIITATEIGLGLHQ